MATETVSTEVTKQEFDELIGKLMRGELRNPKEMRKSRERMDFMREETMKRGGTVYISVKYTRDLRDR